MSKLFEVLVLRDDGSGFVFRNNLVKRDAKRLQKELRQKGWKCQLRTNSGSGDVGDLPLTGDNEEDE